MSCISRSLAFFVIVASVIGVLGLGVSFAEDPKPAGPAPREFDTADAAAKALVEAAAANDDAALAALAGGGSADIVQDGKDPQVAKDRAAFAAAAKKRMTLEEDEGQVTIVVGDEEWPFPIPLVKAGEKWHFDASEGRQEILARRIGRNELSAIRNCRDYVQAQVEYASKDRDGDKVREYAQRLKSTSGTHDGLWWPTTDENDQSPLAAELALFGDAAAAVTKDDTEGGPYMGYTWRVLFAQGDRAPGGAYSYVINGNMIAGFALLGVPAGYRTTGVKCLMVSHHGVVFEKDLGEKTAELAKAIDKFDPDDTWNAVSDDDLADATADD